MEYLNDNAQDGIVPNTPMSRIPQPAAKVMHTGTLSPLSNRNRSQESSVLSDIRPEMINNAPPKMQLPHSALRKPPGLKFNSTTSSLQAARKPPTTDIYTDRRAVSSLGMSSKKLGLNSTFATNTTTGQASVRPKSASSVRARGPTVRDTNSSVKQTSAQDEDVYAPKGGRILSVNNNIHNQPWDMKGRVETMEAKFEELTSRLFSEQNASGTKIDELKQKISTLETERASSELNYRRLQGSAADLQQQIRSLTMDLEDQSRRSRAEREDLEHSLNRKFEGEKRTFAEREEALKRQSKLDIETADHTWKQRITEQENNFKQELSRVIANHDAERNRLLVQINDQEENLRSQFEIQTRELHVEITRLKSVADEERSSAEAAITAIKNNLLSTERSLAELQFQLDAERRLTESLRSSISESSVTSVSLKTTNSSLQARIKLLEDSLLERDQTIAAANSSLANALESELLIKEKLQKEETFRRILHNQVQELKGNIRVFCRVRPLNQTERDPAQIEYPDVTSDGRTLDITGPSSESAIGTAMGTVTTKTSSFAFDKVFSPEFTNKEVFDEISQLVQSALDGYNVCIFCYGQTGSGKTYTMSSEDGMIARAVDQIFKSAAALEERHWKYDVEGQFLEIYNENINDLLVRSDDFDKKKLDMRNDSKEGRIIIPDLTTVKLASQDSVKSMLQLASKNRSVAATAANERSSRSHSVFILTIRGYNSSTSEKCEGTLNLIDLAGSERLMHSQSTGDRLKETVAINKSLSCLRDVITALGSSKEGNHIPYRNSKLTYLLQYSLGGNSKTLMFVNISPLKQHLPETISSLRFATKVNSTHIGTARRR
ncbi:P-loop containing nucleoside triphosphate hydrolase protein [Lipomyces arxii]|uniref:P-loop containing nucleoside triphosphate hydrolase protein n=1 Tax=Lipomyces arxii TaxID=56418 RepID=UPI0034CDB74A